MENKSEMLAIKDRSNGNTKARTSIGIRIITKDKLDNNRAPGQCYDGFITQMVDLWEKRSSK